MSTRRITKKPLNSRDMVTKGCTIKCRGLSVTIDEVLDAHHYENEGWFIEMIDTDGKYRYWKQYMDGGEIYPSDALQELRELCERNFRVLDYEKGLIVTFDRYEGTDAQYFETYEDAVKWERGYLDTITLDDTQVLDDMEDEIVAVM